MKLEEKIKIIIESEAKTINVERVSLWLFDEDMNSISSKNIYLLSKNDYIQGQKFERNAYPNYFKALESGLIIDAMDAANDPRTSEFRRDYLNINSITSIMDVPIRIEGNLIGVLCNEHVGPKRNWAMDEIRFAGSIADLIALAIENDEKTKTEEELLKKTLEMLANEKKFQDIFESLPGLFLVLSPDLKIVAVSEAYLKATLKNRNEIIGQGIFDVFPDNPNNPNPAVYNDMRASFNKVLHNKTSDKMEIHEFDIQRPKSEGDGFEVRYWAPFNSPVVDANGNVIYIIHNIVDVTERKKPNRLDEKFWKSKV